MAPHRPGVRFVRDENPRELCYLSRETAVMPVQSRRAGGVRVLAPRISVLCEAPRISIRYAYDGADSQYPDGL